MLSRQASHKHANHSQSQEKEKVKTMNEICGLKRLIPFALLDRKSHSWKTSQGFLIPDTSEQSSVIWPKSGMMQNGRAYRLPNVEPRTKGKGCGFWRTPDSNCHRRPSSKERMEWKIKNKMPISINDQVKWPTPMANPSGPDFARINREKSGGDSLATTVARSFYPTPQHRDWKGKSQRGNYGNTNDCLPNTVNGQLNPDWVEWLMGWPIGWTESESMGKKSFELYMRKINAGSWWDVDPYETTPRVATGIKNRVSRLKAIGNGQVPAVVATAFKLLTKGLI